MRDSAVAASIVAGQPDGLAEAYDRYADPIYKYCRSMLGDPADAADAVRDTFVITACRLDGLRDTGLLRAWLYAVARNECLRILRERTSAAPAEAPEVTRDDADAGDHAERAGLPALVEDAAAGMNPVERELIALHLRHGLDAAETGVILGVSQGHAQSLLSGAMDQLQACLAVLAVGRAGAGDCAVLEHMLAGWDGKLTPELRWWVYPHIKGCGTCTARRAVELRPAALLGLAPAAAIAAGAAEGLRAAAGPPAALRDHTLALACGQSPSATAHRATVLGRTAPLRPDGFPRPTRAPKAGLLHAAAQGAWLSSPRRQAAAAAGAALAIAIAAVGFTVSGNTGHGPAAAARPPATEPGAPAITATTPATGQSDGPGPHAPATAPGRPSSPSAAKPSATASPAATPAVTPATAPPTPAPSPSAPAPSPTASPPTPAPSPTAPPPTPAPPSPSPSPSAGTLLVSPPGGSIQPGGTTITLTSRGGPVDWSITVSGDQNDVRVWPASSGRLPYRGSNTVTVFIWASQRAVGQRITVNPGGTVFTVG